MTNPVRIPFTRSEVGLLRAMLRIMMLHRLHDHIGSLRTVTKEQVTDSQALDQHLKFVDLWHSHDHMLWKFQEDTPGDKDTDEVGITMHPSAIAFYRDILTYHFTDGGINGGPLYKKMVELAEKNQVPILNKINQTVANAELQTIPQTVFRVPQGRQ